MDKEFFVQAICERGDMMYRIAYTLLHHDEDCKDALQEAALKAWKKRGSLKEPRFFGTWITRILINECHNIQRRRRKTIPLDEALDIADPPPDPTLALLMLALPEKLRLPLVLQYAEGMDHGEIATILHLSPSAVRGRIHRAKLKLRKELEA